MNPESGQERASCFARSVGIRLDNTLVSVVIQRDAAPAPDGFANLCTHAFPLVEHTKRSVRIDVKLKTRSQALAAGLPLPALRRLDRCAEHAHQFDFFLRIGKACKDVTTID